MSVDNVVPIRAGVRPPTSDSPSTKLAKRPRRHSRAQLEARIELQRTNLYRVKNLVGVTRAQLGEGVDGGTVSFDDCEGTLESAEELLLAVLEALDYVNVFNPEREARS